MSASDIALRPSRYAQWAFALTACWPVLLLAITPMPGWSLMLAAVLVLITYWFGFAQWQQLQQSPMVVLGDDGIVHWFATAETGSGRGRLCPGGLVCQWAVRLSWQTDNNKRRQRWIFADQCSQQQFRALARAINQTNWQTARPSAKPEA